MSVAIDRDSAMARLLRMVRAGAISPGTVGERSTGAYNQISEAIRNKWIEKDADGDLLLTPAGRAVCPCANPLAETITAPTGAPLRRVAATTKEVTMKPHANSIQARVLDAIRAAGRDGISRQDLLKKLPDLTDLRIDGAMSVLVREGDAHRPRYGHICIGRAPSRETPAVKVPAAPSVRDLVAKCAEKREAREAGEGRSAQPVAWGTLATHSDGTPVQATAAEPAQAHSEPGTDDMPGCVFTDDPRPLFDAAFLRRQAEAMEVAEAIARRDADAEDEGAVSDDAVFMPTLSGVMLSGSVALAAPLFLVGSDGRLRIRDGAVELLLDAGQTAQLAGLLTFPVSERRAA